MDEITRLDAARAQELRERYGLPGEVEILFSRALNPDLSITVRPQLIFRARDLEAVLPAMARWADDLGIGLEELAEDWGYCPPVPDDARALTD